MPERTYITIRLPIAVANELIAMRGGHLADGRNERRLLDVLADHIVGCCRRSVGRSVFTPPGPRARRKR